MHAEVGKACGETDCEFFKRKAKAPSHIAGQVKIVKREPKDAKASSEDRPELRRKTKKSTLKKPKKWGGRSGS